MRQGRVIARAMEPADWVAVERVKSGQPVGRELLLSERLALLVWAARTGVTDAELANRVILPNGRRITKDAVCNWRRRHQEKLPEDVRQGVIKPESWWSRYCNPAAYGPGRHRTTRVSEE